MTQISRRKKSSGGKERGKVEKPKEVFVSLLFLPLLLSRVCIFQALGNGVPHSRHILVESGK